VTECRLDGGVIGSLSDHRLRRDHRLEIYGHSARAFFRSEWIGASGDQCERDDADPGESAPEPAGECSTRVRSAHVHARRRCHLVYNLLVSCHFVSHRDRRRCEIGGARRAVFGRPRRAEPKALRRTLAAFVEGY
jgi:hypothetical protein